MNNHPHTPKNTVQEAQGGSSSIIGSVVNAIAGLRTQFQSSSRKNMYNRHATIEPLEERLTMSVEPSYLREIAREDIETPDAYFSEEFPGYDQLPGIQEGVYASHTRHEAFGITNTEIHNGSENNFYVINEGLRGNQPGTDHLILTFRDGPQYIHSITLEHLSGSSNVDLYLESPDGSMSKRTININAGEVMIERELSALSIVTPGHTAAYALRAINTTSPSDSQSQSQEADQEPQMNIELITEELLQQPTEAPALGMHDGSYVSRSYHTIFGIDNVRIHNGSENNFAITDNAVRGNANGTDHLIFTFPDMQYIDSIKVEHVSGTTNLTLYLEREDGTMDIRPIDIGDGNITIDAKLRGLSIVAPGHTTGYAVKGIYTVDPSTFIAPVTNDEPTEVSTETTTQDGTVSEYSATTLIEQEIDELARAILADTQQQSADLFSQQIIGESISLEGNVMEHDEEQRVHTMQIPLPELGGTLSLQAWRGNRIPQTTIDLTDDVLSANTGAITLDLAQAESRITHVRFTLGNTRPSIISAYNGDTRVAFIPNAQSGDIEFANEQGITSIIIEPADVPLSAHAQAAYDFYHSPEGQSYKRAITNGEARNVLTYFFMEKYRGLSNEQIAQAINEALPVISYGQAHDDVSVSDIVLAGQSGIAQQEVDALMVNTNPSLAAATARDYHEASNPQDAVQRYQFENNIVFSSAGTIGSEQAGIYIGSPDPRLYTVIELHGATAQMKFEGLSYISGTGVHRVDPSLYEVIAPNVVRLTGGQPQALVVYARGEDVTEYSIVTRSDVAKDAVLPPEGIKPTFDFYAIPKNKNPLSSLQDGIIDGRADIGPGGHLDAQLFVRNWGLGGGTIRLEAHVGYTGDFTQDPIFGVTEMSIGQYQEKNHVFSGTIPHTDTRDTPKFSVVAYDQEGNILGTFIQSMRRDDLDGSYNAEEYLTADAQRRIARAAGHYNEGATYADGGYQYSDAYAHLNEDSTLIAQESNDGSSDENSNNANEGGNSVIEEAEWLMNDFNNAPLSSDEAILLAMNPSTGHGGVLITGTNLDENIITLSVEEKTLSEHLMSAMEEMFERSRQAMDEVIQEYDGNLDELFARWESYGDALSTTDKAYLAAQIGANSTLLGISNIRQFFMPDTAEEQMYELVGMTGTVRPGNLTKAQALIRGRLEKFDDVFNANITAKMKESITNIQSKVSNFWDEIELRVNYANPLDHWHGATFDTVSDSLVYHFEKWAGNRSIEQYTRDAAHFFDKYKQWATPVILRDGSAGFRIKLGSGVGGYWTLDGKIVTFFDEWISR